jgi:hypothetical protein
VRVPDEDARQASTAALAAALAAALD